MSAPLEVTIGDDDDEKDGFTTVRRASDTWLLGVVHGGPAYGFTITMYWPLNTVDRREFETQQAAIDAIVGHQEVPAES